MILTNEPDFMSDVFDLISYVTGIDEKNIFRGNQSREVLPKDGNFSIFTPITRTRIGTNVTHFNGDDVPDSQDGVETDCSLIRADIQIDFYGEDAMRFAQGIETYASSLACNLRLWQNASKMRVLYASNPMDATLVDDTRQYVPRWITTLSVVFTTSVNINVPWFRDLKLHGWKKIDGEFTPASEAGLVNCDVFFKPDKKE